jgi:primosomal protein N' (replication factor Y)
LATLGYGTERVEEVMQVLFPDIRILRMDADTTRQRGSHARILGDFKGGGAELLIGTQLVAKGHDFPDVHLAAVVGVDNILGLPDFRSAERAWSLVTQLAGRAGRGEVAGRVLVQTRHKEHFVFRQLIAGELDLGQFHEAELRQRRALGYPPTTRLVLLRVEGEEKGAVEAFSQELARQLRARALLADPQVLGPVAAPMSRLVGRWRYQLVLRGRGKVSTFRNYLKDVRGLLFKRPPNGIRLITDVDPRNLL